MRNILLLNHPGRIKSFSKIASRLCVKIIGVIPFFSLLLNAPYAIVLVFVVILLVCSNSIITKFST